MQKTAYFLLIFMLALYSSQAQKQSAPIFLKGQIIEGVSKNPLMGSHIVNLNTVIGATTNFDGKFEILTAVNDTLMISYIGYQSIKLKISNDLLKGNELSITLHEKRNEIKEVTVKTHQLIGVLEIDVKQVPKDKFARIHINGMPQTYEVGKASPKSMTSVGAAIYHPIDFMYNMFGKKPKALRKLKKMKEQENLRNILSSKFNREVMQEYLQMTTKQLNELLDDCNYSDYFIRTASDLQVVEAILNCHENYKALQKGSVNYQ
jgi:hypothetical protein